jgi:hypothetical protein
MMSNIPTGTPYTNCAYENCDLPGVCKGQGFCHHPKTGERGATVDKELIEQLAKEHGKKFRLFGCDQPVYQFTESNLEAFAKAYQAAAPIDNVARINKLEWVLKQIADLDPKNGSIGSAVFMAKEALIPDTQAASIESERE